MARRWQPERDALFAAFVTRGAIAGVRVTQRFFFFFFFCWVRGGGTTASRPAVRTFYASPCSLFYAFLSAFFKHHTRMFSAIVQGWAFSADPATRLLLRFCSGAVAV